MAFWPLVFAHSSLKQKKEELKNLLKKCSNWRSYTKTEQHSRYKILMKWMYIQYSSKWYINGISKWSMLRALHIFKKVCFFQASKITSFFQLLPKTWSEMTDKGWICARCYYYGHFRVLGRFYAWKKFENIFGGFGSMCLKNFPGVCRFTSLKFSFVQILLEIQDPLWIPFLFLTSVAFIW